MDALVDATEGGSRLVRMIDSKLSRVRHNAKLTPSFIADDPDFAPSNAAGIVTTPRAEPQGESGDEEMSGEVGESRDNSSMVSGGSGHFSLGKHWEAYVDLPEAVKELDRQLFSILKMNIKGTKQAMLASVTFPSYVQGVCILWKYMGMSRMQRLMAAFTTLDDIKYTGDAALFQGSVSLAKTTMLMVPLPLWMQVIQLSSTKGMGCWDGLIRLLVLTYPSPTLG